MMTKAELVAKLEGILAEVKGEEIEGEEKAKPLYQEAYEALQSIGHPAKAKEVMREIRKVDPSRKGLNPVLTYQALEYNKRHKGTVKRTAGGFWRVSKRAGV